MDHEAAAEVIAAIVPEIAGKLELPDGLNPSHRQDMAVRFNGETAVRLSLAQRRADETLHMTAIAGCTGFNGKEVRVEQHRHVRRRAERLTELDLELTHGVRVLGVKDRSGQGDPPPSAGSLLRSRGAPCPLSGRQFRPMRVRVV